MRRCATRKGKGKAESRNLPELVEGAVIIDGQSVKTTEAGGQRGYGVGKKVKGRKRHIAVDTVGNLLEVVVHAAGIQDRDGARLLLERLGTGTKAPGRSRFGPTEPMAGSWRTGCGKN